MAYSAQNDIQEQIGEDVLISLTDDAGIGSVDESVATRAIEDADAEIDSYCGKRYTLPFSTVPTIIRKASVDIAIYNLYSRRIGASEAIKTRYENVIRWLRDVSTGKASLGADDPDGNPPETDSPDVINNDRIFTSDTLSRF